MAQLTRVELQSQLDEENSAPSRSGHLFFDFYQKAKGRPPISRLPRYIIGLDPGETTGVSVWVRPTPDPGDPDGEYTVSTFQINTSIIEWGVDKLNLLLRPTLPVGSTLVIAESFRIYSWKAKTLSWNSLLTPRLIGCIETLCRLRSLPLCQQSAQQGKGFVTDERLERWNLYIPGKRHGMDATRHVCQALLFQEFTNNV